MTGIFRRAAALAVVLALSALLIVPAGAATRFSDVPADHWAAAEIAEAVDAGLIQGRGDGSFGLGQPMTRASFVTVLGRLMGWKTVTPDEPTFTDVGPEDWFYGAVETACANGAVLSQSDTFRPADAVTREEMASILVRCLGYETLSGLALDLPTTFQDLTTNAGYIAVAYDLGLMNGYSATTFGPDDPASREEAAVVLMRLHDRLGDALPAAVSGVWAGGSDSGAALTDAGKLDAAAVPGLRITKGGQTDLTDDGTVQSVTDTGARALFHVEYDAEALPEAAQAESAAAQLLSAAADAGCQGVLLDCADADGAHKAAYTALAQALKGAMEEGWVLYVTAQAPVWQGESPQGYDYAALGKCADRLVIQVGAYEEMVGGFPTTPPEPLEEVYYALCKLTEQVSPEKLSLSLTTTAAAWVDSGKGYQPGGELPVQELEALLEDGQTYYSERYQAAYGLSEERGRTTAVWYLNADAAAERVQLARLLGVTHVTLSDAASVSESGSFSIAGALWK